MLVLDRMTTNPTTILPTTSFSDAFALMKRNGFRRLPVVDRSDNLVGIVVEKDLLRASPSSATSLSVYEITYLLSQLTVEQVMSTPVITAPPDLPLEEAARVMVNHKIGCLPVVRGRELIGIITETDIFKALAEVLGGGSPTVRLTICVPDKPGELAHLSGLIAAEGANILSLAAFRGRRPDCVAVTLRVEKLGADRLRTMMEDADIQVLNVWEPRPEPETARPRIRETRSGRPKLARRSP